MEMELTSENALESRSLTLLEQANAFVVTTAEHYEAAGEFVMGCKALIAEIKAEFAEPKKKADEAHKAICAMENKLLAPATQAIKVVEPVALAWKQEDDRKAREEFDRQQAEKAKQQEAELLKEAEMLEQWGDTKAAEEKLNYAALPMRQSRFVSRAPKVPGLSTRGNWQPTIISPKTVKREYCEPSHSLIKIHVQHILSHIKKPTPEQIKELEAEVGGIKIEWVEGFSGRVGK